MGRQTAKSSAIYQLPLTEPVAAEVCDSREDGTYALPEPVLIGNVLLFCRLRWLVAGVLVAFGAASFAPEAFLPLGLVRRKAL